jgi:hypothetical protein
MPIIVNQAVYDKLKELGYNVAEIEVLKSPFTEVDMPPKKSVKQMYSIPKKQGPKERKANLGLINREMSERGATLQHQQAEQKRLMEQKRRGSVKKTK